MATAEETIHSRPPMALRVGITGARNLRADQVARIERDLQMVLQMIRSELECLAGVEAVHDGYECSQPGKLDASLIFLSPLARGADRLAARTALDVGYELCVPMPFALTEYEKDFVGSSPDKPEIVQMAGEEDLAEFRELLGRSSSHFGLDGARNGTGHPFERALEGASYEAVGRYVVRHSDVVIAIWNGKPSAGRGGTAEIVDYAARARVPTWWIHAELDLPPTWMIDAQDLRDPKRDKTQAFKALSEHLARLIPPPIPTPRRPHSPTDRWFGRRAVSDVSLAHVYFEEVPLRRSFAWKTYSFVISLLSGEKPPWSPPRRPEEPVAGYWFDHYATADAQAAGYADRYRSSYVLIITFSTLALIFGVLAPGFTWAKHEDWLALAFPLGELLMLAAIVLLLAASSRGEWHRRSIEYRLLAELARKQQMLAPLGWAVPVASVQHMATRDWVWVAWLFAALQRGSPLPHAEVASRKHNEDNFGALTELIEEQRQYHRDREKMADEASKRLEVLVLIFFLLVLVAVGLKIPGELLTWNRHTVFWLGFAATALPTISAAFVALRSYAELQLLAEQSFHMLAEMDNAKARVECIDLDRPLASQELGAEAAAIASVMLQDLEGWGRLFRGKAMEAG